MLSANVDPYGIYMFLPSQICLLFVILMVIFLYDLLAILLFCNIAYLSCCLLVILDSFIALLLSTIASPGLTLIHFLVFCVLFSVSFSGHYIQISFWLSIISFPLFSSTFVSFSLLSSMVFSLFWAILSAISFSELCVSIISLFYMYFLFSFSFFSSIMVVSDVFYGELFLTSSYFSVLLLALSFFISFIRESVSS